MAIQGFKNLTGTILIIDVSNFVGGEMFSGFRVLGSAWKGEAALPAHDCAVCGSRTLQNWQMPRVSAAAFRSGLSLGAVISIRAPTVTSSFDGA